MQPWSQPLLWQGGAAGITPTTFDPASVQSVTLSGGNLVATNTGTTGTNQGAQALASSAKSSGKYYWETTYNIWGDGSVFCLYGCALIPTGTSAYNTAGTTGIGGARIAITGAITANGTGGGTLGSLSQGDTIAIAVDIAALKIWFRGVAGPDFGTPGQWNGSAINGDPATGAGGTTIIGGSLVPAVCFGGTGGVSGNRQTANFGGSAFLAAVPAGFTAGWPA
jgi:hypothetical protein